LLFDEDAFTYPSLVRPLPEVNDGDQFPSTSVARDLEYKVDCPFGDKKCMMKSEIKGTGMDQVLAVTGRVEN